MKSKLNTTVITGIAGTAAMSAFMYLGSFVGLPKMNPAEMLSISMGFSLLIGWILHFVIGIIFAALYNFIFADKVRIKNIHLKGISFGITAFVIAQIAMGAMSGLMEEMPEPTDPMPLIMMGSILGHLVFGWSVVLLSTKVAQSENE